MSTTRQALREALEDAALAGAKEIKEFLGTYRGSDPERFKRVHIAVAAVSGYTRWQASQNNMAATMMSAARQTGVSTEQTLEIAKLSGLIPEAAESKPLKLAK